MLAKTHLIIALKQCSIVTFEACSGLANCGKIAFFNMFTFKQVEKRFHRGIVVRITFAAHTADHAGFL